MPPKVTKLKEGGQGQKRVTKEDPPESGIAMNNKKVRLQKGTTEIQEKSDNSERNADVVSEEKRSDGSSANDDSDDDEYSDIRQKKDEIAHDDETSDYGAGEVNMVHRRDETTESTPGSLSSKASNAGSRGLANESSYIDQKRDAKKHLEEARKAIINLQDKDLKDTSQRIMIERLVAYLNTCIAFERVIAEALEGADKDTKELWRADEARAIQIRNDFRDNPGEKAIKIILHNATYTWATRKGIKKPGRVVGVANKSANGRNIGDSKAKERKGHRHQRKC